MIIYSQIRWNKICNIGFFLSIWSKKTLNHQEETLNDESPFLLYANCISGATLVQPA
jgi:hypothetical protein